MQKQAFTLAEIMIVLSVVGILTAILLPVAFHSAPDENIMKFKKANNTLGIVIRELVNSDKYYANGDLGIKPDGTLTDGTHTGDFTYFCESFADIISAKSVNCSAEGGWHSAVLLRSNVGDWSGFAAQKVTKEILDGAKNALDIECADTNTTNTIGAEIVASDGITYYQGNPQSSFGISSWYCGNKRCYSAATDSVTYPDENGFDVVYKVFCIDVDGIGKGEDPFGYGIRADGKILSGARADEWVNKSVQKGE